MVNWLICLRSVSALSEDSAARLVPVPVRPLFPSVLHDGSMQHFMVVRFLRHLFVSLFFLNFEELYEHEFKHILDSVVGGSGALNVRSLETLGCSLAIKVIDLPLVWQITLAPYKHNRPQLLPIVPTVLIYLLAERGYGAHGFVVVFFLAIVLAVLNLHLHLKEGG